MIQVQPSGVNAGTQAAPDAATDASQAAPPSVACDAATAALLPRDPLAALESANGLHADVRPLIGHAPGGPAHGADPWAFAGQPARFASGIVLAGSPLAAKAAPLPDKIGGPNPPLLERGKASGKIVENLQGHLNAWRERQWRDQQGHPGYPSERVATSGNYDSTTTQAVKEFQQRMGLPVTGVADAATQHLLKLESDPHYARDVSESNKQLVRQLVASLGNDAARIDAVTTLLDSSGFRSLYDSADKGRVIAALLHAKADPAFVQGLDKLLTHAEFKWLQPDDKSAVLHYASNPAHANAKMVGDMLKMFGTAADRTLMVQLGNRELKAHEAAVATREPALALGRHGASTPHLPSTTGMIPATAWSDPIALVGQLRQSATTSDDVNAKNRCGPTNLLAAALLQGPDAAAKFLENVAAKAGNLTKDERADLKSIAGQLRSRNVSFEDLSLAMDLAYRAGDRRMSIGQWLTTHPSLGQTPPTLPGLSNTEAARLATLILKQDNAKPHELQEMSQLVSKASGVTLRASIADDNTVNKRVVVLNYKAGEPGLRDGSIPGGFDDGELLALAGIGAKRVDNVAYDLRGNDPLGAVLQRLKPGESAVIPLSGTPTGNKPDHYISVGILKDGRPYIYNPDPFRGDATLTVGRSSGPQTQSFTDELGKYTQRANQVSTDITRRAIVVAN